MTSFLMVIKNYRLTKGSKVVAAAIRAGVRHRLHNININNLEEITVCIYFVPQMQTIKYIKHSTKSFSAEKV
jgi:hypothetical protein